jgi:hypothetical protein
VTHPEREVSNPPTSLGQWHLSKCLPFRPSPREGVGGSASRVSSKRTHTDTDTPLDMADAMPAGGSVTSSHLQWCCTECEGSLGVSHKACTHILRPTRCLCGHTLGDHPAGGKCSNKSCDCRAFFYIFRQGAMVLRCECKHKAEQHDATSPEHKCKVAGCKCANFLSPWVCNCGHKWSAHEQRTVRLREGETLPKADMKGPDGLVRGNDLGGGLAHMG